MTLGFELKQLGKCCKFYLDWEHVGMNGFVEQGITKCSMLRLRCLSRFHGFRSLELSEERFVLEMVVKR